MGRASRNRARRYWAFFGVLVGLQLGDKRARRGGRRWQLYARTGSCTTGTQLSCSDNLASGGEEVISFPVSAATKYSVFVDGAPGETGPYTIAFDLD